MKKSLIIWAMAGMMLPQAHAQEWDLVTGYEASPQEEDAKPLIPEQFQEAQARRPFRMLDDYTQMKTAAPGFVPVFDDPALGPRSAPTTAQLRQLDRGTRCMFFGSEVPFRYDSPMQFRLAGTASNREYAAAWAQLERSKHSIFLLQLLDYGRRMGFNDWAYCLLLHQTAARIYPGDTRAQVLFLAFCLDKSGYASRVCDDGKRLYLALPARQMIYQNTYFYEGNTRFFLIDPVKGIAKASKLRVISLPYSPAGRPLDLHLNRLPQLQGPVHTRALSFSYRGQTYRMSVPVNRGLVAFYNTMPFTDLDVQGRTPVSPAAKQAMLRVLKPLLAGKSQQEAAAILLHFVQTAFPYRTDQQQFGKEKYLFVEETLFYPYSDCEDRSVLYAWLVRELMGLDVIGLIFPGHAATGVRFTEKMAGDAVTYRGQKYYICDPTYINAPPGRCMPSVLNKSVNVIEL